jgi:uncharacterized protein YndB with AHSA1/START domain
VKIFYSIFLIIIFAVTRINAQNESTGKAHYDVFTFEKQVTLPGTPEIIFDAVTGDISGWWDHHMSEHPKKFFIEPKPGGGFWEIFDDEGNGVLHATVIYADRGKLLRFDGPLGLSGKAIQMVTTYQFEPAGNDSTLFKVSVHASGEVDEGIPALVEGVWEHFIFEQLKPYIESGKQLKK